jgi:acetyltransferase-like isoleucine patch superfamily enzyme
MIWLRALFNRLRRALLFALQHRIVFGEYSQGRALPYTRISPSVCIEFERRLTLGDHVFIGPYCFLEASGGITLGEGVQVTHHVSIVTHSSHRAMRLLGPAYADAELRPAALRDDAALPGWVAGAVAIGPYSFIGPHTLIEAGTRLGRGCIVGAGSVVRGQFADFSVIEGRPGVVVGDARDRDAPWLAHHPELRPLYEGWAGAMQGRREAR